MRAWDVLFALGAQKYNQNNLASLLNFSDLTQLSGFFGHVLGFKFVFGFGPGSGLYFRVRAWTSRPVYNSGLLYYISLSRAYFLLNPHSDRYGHVFALTCFCFNYSKMLVSGSPDLFVMTLDSFNGLLYVRTALEKKTQKRFYTAIWHLILRLNLSRNAI